MQGQRNTSTTLENRKKSTTTCERISSRRTTSSARLARWSRIDCAPKSLRGTPKPRRPPAAGSRIRSEEHTSELQSRQYLVCRLLLEKKKRTRRKGYDNSATIFRSLSPKTHIHTTV